MPTQKEKTMEETLTPFERSTEFVNSLAEGLYHSYTMLNYIPVLEDLEQQSIAAGMRGDARSMTTLAHIQSALCQQLPAFAFEA